MLTDKDVSVMAQFFKHCKSSQGKLKLKNNGYLFSNPNDILFKLYVRNINELMMIIKHIFIDVVVSLCYAYISIVAKFIHGICKFYCENQQIH